MESIYYGIIFIAYLMSWANFSSSSFCNLAAKSLSISSRNEVEIGAVSVFFQGLVVVDGVIIAVDDERSPVPFGMIDT